MRCFRMRGGKGKLHLEPDDPPRRRANKRRGHGTYENDRPPIIGTMGRMSGHVRLRVIERTDETTLSPYIQAMTRAESSVYTDDW
ncbi:MAG: hypothetical protein ACTS2F_09760 [Thainema sp.]